MLRPNDREKDRLASASLDFSRALPNACVGSFFAIMATLEPRTPFPHGTSASFRTTHWTEIVNPQADEARCAVARRYYYPIYAFLRRSGKTPDEARELTHSFFKDFLTRDTLAKVDPKKGCFRNFLLACLKYHVCNLIDKAEARIRNPGQAILSIDEQDAEGNYLREPVDIGDPAKLFDRRCALMLIDEVLGYLRSEYTAAGKATLFGELCNYFVNEPPHGECRRIAERLGLSHDAVRAAATRLRDDFKMHFRATVGNTVSDPLAVDEEIKALLHALRR
jgi:hypothetical protein